MIHRSHLSVFPRLWNRHRFSAEQEARPGNSCLQHKESRGPVRWCLCGAIGSRVRLLAGRLVVRAHPGTGGRGFRTHSRFSVLTTIQAVLGPHKNIRGPSHLRTAASLGHLTLPTLYSASASVFLFTHTCLRQDLLRQIKGSSFRWGQVFVLPST